MSIYPRIVPFADAWLRQISMGIASGRPSSDTRSMAQITNPMTANATAKDTKDQYLFGNLESSAQNRQKVREVSFGYDQPEGIILTSLDTAVN